MDSKYIDNDKYTFLGVVHYHPQSDYDKPALSGGDENVAKDHNIAMHVIDADGQTSDLYSHLDKDYQLLVDKE